MAYIFPGYHGSIFGVIRKYYQEFKNEVEVISHEMKFYEFSLYHCGVELELVTIVRQLSLFNENDTYRNTLLPTRESVNIMAFEIIERTGMRKYLSRITPHYTTTIKDVVWVPNSYKKYIPKTTMYHLINFRLFEKDDIPFYLLQD